MEFQMKLKRFLKQETVLSVAAVLAVLSMFFVPPDADYLGYIDLRTLAILFSLMTIMAGLRRQGVFDRMGRALLARTGSTLQLVLVLVGLCFFGSMIITNDVSLLTFVPFTFVVLSGLAPDTRRALTIPVVCMQTIAANLGSMLTPIGNPQNLYLYGKSGMRMAEFLLLMLPYTIVSLLLLVGWAVAVCRKQASSCIGALPEQPNTTADRKIILLDAVLFAGWLQAILAGREVLVAVLASQVTSNVPAALLLSGFTDETAALIIGTNLGGLGTLIASMASLISYRQIARELPEEKGRYFKLFTLSNLIFLVILLAEWRLIGR